MDFDGIESLSEEDILQVYEKIQENDLTADWSAECSRIWTCYGFQRAYDAEYGHYDSGWRVSRYQNRRSTAYSCRAENYIRRGAAWSAGYDISCYTSGDLYCKNEHAQGYKWNFTNHYCCRCDR